MVYHVLPFFPKNPSQCAMFNRSKLPPANTVDNAVGNGVNDNSYITDDPNGAPPGQRSAVHGFVLAKWLRLHLVDLITMATMGAIGLGVYYARKSVFGTA